jgi:hypothetical protein
MRSRSSKKQRRNFSSFTLNEAFKLLGIEELTRWNIDAPPLLPSQFYQEHMRRLEQFDLTSSESAKALIIDAICEEVMIQHPRLKVWKEASLQSDQLGEVADYLIAPKRDYLEAPLLCVIEAKKDDFEAGLTQCLVEMHACQWNNAQLGKQLDVFGVVTNGDLWRFYQFTKRGEVLESLSYALGELSKVLGTLHAVLGMCEAQLR